MSDPLARGTTPVAERGSDEHGLATVPSSPVRAVRSTSVHAPDKDAGAASRNRGRLRAGWMLSWHCSRPPTRRR
ncbi:hypothetical protein trd_A0145 (plasmid) [Thermomicrobium roseum DSM 5159]|uniref:Uncharacterized protein n=1 Tax=Thermomicrobium roseum (strain ATCC 27502 / DSM 5159 / P-2) TaxID=309801 RepID=B9L2Y0_THERP|nr:hypothetical protein trd_A0145 [Thermomicrobium roseum DSM 5159]